jgi:hypothetical protein
MGQKIRLKINGKTFDLDLDNDFASFLIEDLSKNLNKENISIKDLLSAYVRKNYELHQFNLKIQEIDTKLS